MARGRDLTIEVLSDAEKFDLERPAQELEDLGRTADAAGERLEDLQRDLTDSSSDLKDVGDDAARAARDIDEAFDKIARSSKDSERKVDTTTDDMGSSLKDVGDEAADTGREMFASFSGSLDDIQGAAQELAANAGGMFGPAGLAIGGALAVGISMFTAAKEKMKEQVAEIVDSLIEGAGRIEEESIVAQLREWAQDGSLDEIRRQAEAAGVSADTYARALAGDADALDKLDKRVDGNIKKLADHTKTGGRSVTQIDRQARALSIVSERLGTAAGATETARKRWETYRDATRSGITVGIKLPTAAEMDAANRAMRAGIGTIVVPVAPGQSKYENTANNSRYKW